jgi:SnoaL-like protein
MKKPAASAPPRTGRPSADAPEPELEPPIGTMIDATNQGDTETLLSVFADDAILTDWGRTFSGKAEIARWNSDENIGTKNKIRVTAVERAGKEVKVSVVVSGSGYNGSGVLSFQVEGHFIQRLVIT